MQYINKQAHKVSKMVLYKVQECERPTLMGRKPLNY